MMLDIYTGELQFQGRSMAMGFIKECWMRPSNIVAAEIVGGKKLIELDQVQCQIAPDTSAFTVVQQCVSKSGSVSGIAYDLSAAGIEAIA
jgi:hypothetical protein